MASASAAALRVSESLRANRSGPIRGSRSPSGPGAAAARRADSQARCSARASRAAGRTSASRGPEDGPGDRRERGVDLLAGQRDRAVELPDGGLQVHPGHGPELPPGLGQHGGNLGQPPGHRGEPVRQRGEVPGQQLIDGPPRVGQQRVPGVFGQLVKLEHPPGHAVRHHRGVDPVLGRQRAEIQGVQPGGPAVQGAPLVGPGGLGRVTEPVVEPVVAQAGGQFRMPFRPVVEVLVRQPRELPIGLAVHRASFRRSRNTNGMTSWPGARADAASGPGLRRHRGRGAVANSSGSTSGGGSSSGSSRSRSPGSSSSARMAR